MGMQGRVLRNEDAVAWTRKHARRPKLRSTRMAPSGSVMMSGVLSMTALEPGERPERVEVRHAGELPQLGARREIAGEDLTLGAGPPQGVPGSPNDGVRSSAHA
jgi:hypothetical protein